MQMSEKFKEAMLAAQAELEQLEQRRAALLRVVESLRAASGDEQLEIAPPAGYEPKGLTEEIRTVLKLTTVHLDPVQIRDSLIRRGFTSMTPRNLLISVHTVISRLWDARELDVIQRDGKPAYKRRLTLRDLAGIPGRIHSAATLSDGLPVSNPSHPIHNPPPIVRKTEGEGFEPKYGSPDPLNQRGKKRH
jgi:hypothetical protein